MTKSEIMKLAHARTKAHLNTIKNSKCKRAYPMPKYAETFAACLKTVYVTIEQSRLAAICSIPEAPKFMWLRGWE